MENFVTKGINIARDRIYRPVHEGGLGLIPLEQYIQGLHCSWFKRAYTMANDNWKFDIHQAYRGDIINIKYGYTDGELGTVLSGLVNSYTAFQHKFTQYGNNYMCLPVINNDNFGYGRNQSIRINSQFFGHDLMDRHGLAIRALRWNDCTVNGTFVPIRHFNEHVGIPFTREQYYDLKTCAADFSLLNLPKGKSLGRSKPATSSYAQAPQHTVWDDSYYIQALLNCLL
jgi:hypothetical protein